MYKRSIKTNMVLNALKGLMSILFPLISFPYISRILNTEGIGKYNFANSVISYFVLLAGLGISTYAVREGARFREQSVLLREFVNEMFSINLISTAVSYLLLAVTVLFVPKFQNYLMLMLILSLQMFFRAVGIDWIYSIYEDYAYITIRCIFFQFLSLLLLFLFVKTEDDVNVYAVITVFASVGSNVFNYIHSRKYCRIKWTCHIKWKQHLKPILVLFAMSVTVTLYVSSDITILGFLCDDHTVGIYSVSAKIYTIIKNMLSSMLIVSVPRLSSMLGKNDDTEFQRAAADVYGILLTVVIPAIVGIFMLRKEIVLLIAGKAYLSAASPLALLSIALFFCLGAWFWGQCILIPLKLEHVVFKGAAISSFVNMIFNFIFIPIWKEDAAAFTTVLAEAISFAWCMAEGRKHVKIAGSVKILKKALAGSAGIVLAVSLLKHFVKNIIVYIPSAVIISVLVYFAIEMILKNDIVRSSFYSVLKKIWH